MKTRGGRIRTGLGAVVVLAVLGIEAAPLAGQSALGAGQAPVPDTTVRPVVRPIPEPFLPPSAFMAAVNRGTRTPTGRKGPVHWTQHTTYEIDARLDPEAGTVTGSGVIRYANNSPDTLAVLVLNLYQNLHAPGVVRNEPQEVTGGIDLDVVRLNGEEVPLSGFGRPGAYQVDGTVMTLRPPEPVLPGQTSTIEIDWSFRVPQAGAGGRMGWSEREVYFIGYWYPRMAVYDDIRGWDAEPFQGNGEFYDGFGDYRVSLTVPGGWTVMATGSFDNPGQVLSDRTMRRISEASNADTLVVVADPQDRIRGTVTRPDEELTYRFSAGRVRDFAWTASNAQTWSATSAVVPDRNGDGQDDRVLINSFWRPDRAPLWEPQAMYAKHAIEFESRYTGFAYPWTHMTSVEGTDIIEGGMEFPAMTVMGSYQGRGADALYNVTAHELAHMWIPMVVGTNERRYAWMDEGWTTYLENQARPDIRPDDPAEELERENYFSMVRAGGEVALMLHADRYPTYNAYGAASYWKPATLFSTLRELVGEEAFLEAYRGFIGEWAYAHPTPWDFFYYFQNAVVRDLSWFWTSWFFEAWPMDHGIASVEPAGPGPDGSEGSVITVVDRGWAFMPARVRVTTSGGEAIDATVPVETWLAGRTRGQVRVPVPPSEIVRVQVDPERAFPDIDRSNDVWEAP